jgi:TetR/AcrR family transcriptional regulator, fatty acid metabolism regulator protein
MSRRQKVVQRERGQPRSQSAAQQSRQEEVLRLAYRLMATKGMHRMTLQDVADAAGMSKANVVYHYKTKEDLVLTAMRWVLEQVAARIVDATASAKGRDAKIRAMIDAVFVDPKRNRTFYVVYAELIAHSSRDGRFADVNEWFRDVVTGQYAEVIGSMNTRSKKSLAESATIVRALIDGLFLQWLEEPDWQATHAQYKDLCARSIIAFLDSGSI